jgi:hypothetical protein
VLGGLVLGGLVLGGLVLGDVDAGAGVDPLAGLVFVEEDPHAARPAATARPRAAPKISFRAPARLSRMTILSGASA